MRERPKYKGNRETGHDAVTDTSATPHRRHVKGTLPLAGGHNGHSEPQASEALHESTELTPTDAAKLEAALRLCRRELAQVRQRQEVWWEQTRLLPKVRRQRDELARLLAGQLSAGYWARSRPAQTVPGGLRGRIARLVLEFGRRSGHACEREDEWRCIEVIERSPYFDGGWYLCEYPDVIGSGATPAEHYLKHGAAEGRNPGPKFSTKFYLANNPDVAQGGGNPLVHFMLFGEGEGRLPMPAKSTS